jgi:hypothetical protein
LVAGLVSVSSGSLLEALEVFLRRPNKSVVDSVLFCAGVLFTLLATLELLDEDYGKAKIINKKRIFQGTAFTSMYRRI